MADDELKRTSILLPRELHEKFIEYSKDEYKNTSAMIVEWMSQYVKAKERELFEQREVKDAFLRLSDLIFLIGSSLVKQSNIKQIHTELSTILLELSNNPATCLTADYTTKVRLLERKIKDLAINVTD